MKSPSNQNTVSCSSKFRKFTELYFCEEINFLQFHSWTSHQTKPAFPIFLCMPCKLCILNFLFSTFNRNNLNSKGLSLNLSTHPSDLIIQFICFGFYIDCGLQKFVKQVLRDYSYKSFNLTEIAGTVQTFVRVFFFLTKLNVLWKKGLFYTK